MRKRILSLILVMIAICCVLFAIKSVYYQIDQERCHQCGRCTIDCAPEAIQFNEQTGGLFIDQALCTGCGNCLQNCPYGAIYSVTGNSDNTIPGHILYLSHSPNPMRAYTDFKYSLPKEFKQAVLTVVNNKGQSVYIRTIDKTQSTFRWNGTDSQGKYLPGGVYIARLICGNARTTNKITLVR